ncbi:MAG: M20/M25/M40 family metallo-hydrolase, partial [Oscillospiraceae bacterium]
MEFDAITLEKYAQGLGSLVRIPTVSKNETDDLSDFYKLHQQIKLLFPLVSEKVECTVLRGTLLFCWRGADAAALPILFMGHQDVVPANETGWDVPCYSGTVMDGALYGRGT